jgi:hypothetical protein
MYVCMYVCMYVDMYIHYNSLYVYIYHTLYTHTHTHTQEDEDALTEGAEEDFLDPIMHTLMRDPVRLPASGTNFQKFSVLVM